MKKYLVDGEKNQKKKKSGKKVKIDWRQKINSKKEAL